MTKDVAQRLRREGLRRVAADLEAEHGLVGLEFRTGGQAEATEMVLLDREMFRSFDQQDIGRYAQLANA